MKPDHHYINPKLVQLYDLDSGWSEDRAYYLNLAQSKSSKSQSILDLGCGTGLICDAYAAKGHHVMGADPALPMLEAARNKPYGHAVQWHHSTAQDFISEQRFDLIIMTGHAFQVLLNKEDIQKTFAAISQHLNDDGLCVFESRNPYIDWMARWDYTMDIEMADGTMVKETRKATSYAEQKMHFTLRYQFPDDVLISESELLFLKADEIQNLFEAESLKLNKLVGHWDDTAFDPDHSEEMIFHLRKA